MPLSSLPSSGELYRLIVENIIELVAVLDAEGEVLYASPGHEHMLGYPPAELIGGNLRRLVHPDDVALVGNLLEQTLGLHRQNEPSLTERAALVADHVLYGVVVASSPWPHEPQGA